VRAVDTASPMLEGLGMRLAATALVSVALVLLATAATNAPARKPFRVGLVADAAVLNDRTAGHSLYLGLRRAVAELHVEGRVLTPSPKEGLTPSIAYLARQSYDAVVVVSVDPATVERLAREFPKTTFVVPDQVIPRRLPNVRSVVFRDEQVGFLVGYLGALMEKRRAGRDVLASIGGGRYPSVERYIAGFRAGARAADPAVVLLNDYSDDFVDPLRCRGVATDQIARGARVIFPVAGNCGFGALSAARVGHVWGIGVDTDQSYLGAFVLSSAVKREDVALFQTIRALRDGSLRGGGTSVFSLRNGGLQLGRVSPGVPSSVRAAVERMQRRIVAGKIRIPTALS
jgi:basic membrane protein A and related proteins